MEFWVEPFHSEMACVTPAWSSRWNAPSWAYRSARALVTNLPVSEHSSVTSSVLLVLSVSMRHLRLRSGEADKERRVVWSTQPSTQWKGHWIRTQFKSLSLLVVEWSRNGIYARRGNCLTLTPFARCRMAVVRTYKTRAARQKRRKRSDFLLSRACTCEPGRHHWHAIKPYWSYA